VSRILTRENKDGVLVRIRGKSQREVEAIVADYEPLASVPRDRVRTVVVRVPVATASAVMAHPQTTPPVLSVEKPAVEAPVSSGPDCRPGSEHDRNGCGADTRNDRPAGQTNLQRRALLQFSASEAFMAKLERVRSLAWHQLPADASLEQVFELALDYLIERKDPSVRRTKMKQKPEPRQVETASNPRHIPAATRNTIYVRDKGRCTFVGSNGRRCGSTRALQVDHVKPVAFGGAGTPDNLRLLCAYHNRFEAERLLGPAVRRDRPHADERPPTRCDH